MSTDVIETSNVAAAVDAALPLVRQHRDDVRNRRRLPDDVELARCAPRASTG